MKSSTLAMETSGLAGQQPGSTEVCRVVMRRQSSISAAQQIWVIAGKEFSDRFRNGWVIACTLVWLGAIGLTSCLGLIQIGRIGIQGYERTVITLLNLVQYLVPLLGLLLGHDLLVGETEERTSKLMLAGGVSRARLLLGKFAGGSFSLAVPLIAGFIIAGTAIGLSTKDSSIASFVRLAISGLLLGNVFLAVGLTISTFSRTRVQSLVLALMCWCVAVFVFDLAALGWLVSTKATAATHEIEVVCDATHVNSAADIHSEFDKPLEKSSRIAEERPSASLGWLAINPVDLFRITNLAAQTTVSLPWSVPVLSLTFWFAATLGASFWRLNRIDL